VSDPTASADPDRTLDDRERPDAVETIADPAVTTAGDAGMQPIREVTVGQTIGRHRILGRLGAGGMGVVFEAHDPELDRHIAIKVIHRTSHGSVDTTARARMKREAQSMAKLSHPNVIVVYDVGEFDEHLYIAMELVDGRSLEDWMNERRRDREQLLEVFQQAGRGLAAAHRAGLVHRDFKPDNVMVELEPDDPERVRRAVVLDFGLASATGEKLETPDGASSPPDAMSLRVTTTGAIMGTPAYMSPEQMKGIAADARSDQFSFCVALWEAMHGERPFPGKDVFSLVASVTTGEIKQPKFDGTVPWRVHQALLRGLSTDPAERFSSMDELLRALRPKRRRGPIVATAAASLVVGGGAAWLWSDVGSDLCTGAADEIATVWGPDQQARTRAAFTDTGLSFAEQTWSSVDARLQDWTQRWTVAHTEACEATHVRKERSEQILDEQMRCLYAARKRARTLVNVLEEGGGDVVERASKAAGDLPSPRRCLDLEALDEVAPLPDDPARVASVERIRGELIEVEGLQLQGEITEALTKVEGLVAEATPLGFDPLLAELGRVQAELQESAGDYAAAKDTMVRVYNLALGQGHDVVAREVAADLVFVVGVQLRDLDGAERWVDATRAMMQRTDPGPGERGRIQLHFAALLEEQGKYEEAEKVALEALALLMEAHGENDTRLITARGQLASLAVRRGDFEMAQSQLEEAIAIAESLGPEHPEVGRVRANLGVTLARQGKPNEALVEFQEAIRILEATYGDEHPDLASLWMKVGGMRYELGRFEEALVAHGRALEIHEKTLGADHPEVARIYDNMANAYDALGDMEKALELYDESIRVTEGAYGPDHPGLVITLGNKGNTLMRLDRTEEAIPVFRRAVAISEAAHGKDGLPVAYPLTGLAHALATSGKPEEALPMFERALRIRTGKPIAPQLLGSTRYSLALALFETGGDLKRARALARQARADFLAAPQSEHEAVERIDAFLADVDKRL
jgi:tetratricopeptide (TPR) repeat protein